jgi:hypothetical protein
VQVDVCIDESAIRPSRVMHSVAANRGTLRIRHLVPPLFRNGEIFWRAEFEPVAFAFRERRLDSTECPRWVD